MSNARNLANFVSTGNPLADGTIDAADITGVVATSDIDVIVQAFDADTAKLDVIQIFSANQTVAAEFKANSYNESYVEVTSTTNAATIDCESGNTFSHTLTENTTFTFSNPPATGTAFAFTLKLVQDAGASGYTVTWPASVDYAGATAPTLTADANAVDVFVFYTHDGGTNWYGFVAGKAMGTPV